MPTETEPAPPPPSRSARWAGVAGLTVALGAVAAAALTTGANSPPPEPAELPLTRVVLSSSGLGQFGHEGPAAAGTSIGLAVRRDQVDDVLKSLTVFDAAGALGPVSLPGRDPLDQLFRDLPFDREALGSPAGLLNALVGSEVEISGPVSARGRILRVEPEKVALPDNGGTVTHHRLALMTERGLVQAVLEDLSALSFTDPAARRQIERALGGMAENRARDRRRLSIEVQGQGSRPIAVSYVVAAPIWKTSWRLVLPQAEGKARLQGWAILENLTGGDWNGVDLTLVSGNPVALTQPLYTAMFGRRTPVPLVATLPPAPRPDTEARREPAAPMAMAMPAPAARSGGGRAEKMAPTQDALTLAPPSPALAEAQDQPAQIVYHFPGKVSLATGHTLMIPLVDREIPAERVWLYQPDTAARHPLVALKLRNESDTALPPGIVTAYEITAGGPRHVGDAMLPLVPRDASRFLALALDPATEIRRDDRGIQTSVVGTIAEGRLTTTTRARHVVAYEITPPPDEDRALVVEEPRRPGWEPSAETREVETAGTLHRWRIAAAKGQTTRAEFVTEHSEQQTLALSSLAPDELLVRISGLENASPALKETVERLSTIVAAITKAQGQHDRNQEERGRIAQDQERIRANLESVGTGSDLGKQYLQTMRGQENRLAELERQDRALDEAIATQRKAAEELVAKLTL
ncbi:hypothetical protein [Phaeospirillum tilakii]|uniref:DUF4139 domain-containing protein n=1 Tax=Phaeospirillum tilakii TaxID=741673 RepID=A0ABW5CA78_9PROT